MREGIFCDWIEVEGLINFKVMLNFARNKISEICNLNHFGFFTGLLELLQEVGYRDTDLIGLTQDRGSVWALVNEVMNFRIP
jgi:hypothetical protein